MLSPLTSDRSSGPSMSLGKQGAGFLGTRARTPVEQLSAMYQPPGPSQQGRSRPPMAPPVPQAPQGRGGMDLAQLGALIMAANNNPAGSLFIQMRSEREREARLAEQFTAEQARLAENDNWRQTYQRRPTIRTTNGQVVAVPWDGAGQPEVLHTAPEDFEVYADAMGLEPDTPEYETALQDFVLRGSGPTAHDFRTEMEGTRQSNRLGLEGVRQTHRLGLEGVRQSGRAALQGNREDRQDRRFDRGERGRNDRFQRGQDGQNHRATLPARPSAQRRGGNSARARAMLNGRAIVVRGGRWVDEQTGSPVQ